MLVQTRNYKQPTHHCLLVISRSSQKATVPHQWPTRNTLITFISVCSTDLLWLLFFLGWGKLFKSFIFWEGLTVKGARIFIGLTASSTTDDPIYTRVQDAKTFLKMKRIPFKIKVVLCNITHLFQNNTNTRVEGQKQQLQLISTQKSRVWAPSMGYYPPYLQLVFGF